MAVRSHTLYETLAPLDLGPNYESLLSPASGGNFLRFDPSSTTWSCSKQPFTAVERTSAIQDISARLFEVGMDDFPDHAQMSRVICRINAFFTDERALCTLPNSQLRLPGHEEARNEIRFSVKACDESKGYEWLSPGFPSLIVTEDGQVYPTASHLYNLRRRKWVCPVEARVDKTLPACKLTKQVDKEVDSYLDLNPQDRSFDHGVIDMMQESLKLQFTQNPVLMRTLQKTQESTLSCVVQGYPFGHPPYHEFDDGTQGPLFELVEGGQESLIGRNWLGTTLKSLRDGI